MNLDEAKKIIARREALVDSVPDEFIAQVNRAQKELNRQVAAYFADLKRTRGKIDNVPANVQMAVRSRNQIRTWLRGAGYFDAVKQYGASFDELAGLGRDFYSAMDLKGTFTERDFKQLSLLRKEHINYFAAGDDAVASAVYHEVTSAVWSNKSFVDLQDRLGALLLDTADSNGALKKHLSTRAFDACASFDRTIQNIKSAELGLDHFLYSGNMIRDSRDFCKHRVGRVFTKAQVDSWEKMRWTGKNTRVSVWEGLGGYNCRHILSPVTKDFSSKV